jgi:hypothetical protein
MYVRSPYPPSLLWMSASEWTKTHFLSKKCVYIYIYTPQKMSLFRVLRVKNHSRSLVWKHMTLTKMMPKMWPKFSHFWKILKIAKIWKICDATFCISFLLITRSIYYDFYFICNFMMHFLLYFLWNFTYFAFVVLLYFVLFVFILLYICKLFITLLYLYSFYK